MLLLNWETEFILPESLSEEEMKEKFNLFSETLQKLDKECPEASYHGFYESRNFLEFASSEAEGKELSNFAKRITPLFHIGKGVDVSYECFSPMISGYDKKRFYCHQFGYPLKKWETSWEEIHGDSKKQLLIQATKVAFGLE
ncbi:MAG: hypothetical protein DLD55_05705 [candidate division SR1 bacterium]|nr:MAG: hypothetical protein DLD55_05705 [candidate division SR1 bacterium]